MSDDAAAKKVKQELDEKVQEARKAVERKAKENDAHRDQDRG